MITFILIFILGYFSYDLLDHIKLLMFNRQLRKFLRKDILKDIR